MHTAVFKSKICCALRHKLAFKIFDFKEQYAPFSLLKSCKDFKSIANGLLKSKILTATWFYAVKLRISFTPKIL